MTNFTDTNGNTWTVALTMPEVLSLNKAHGANFLLQSGQDFLRVAEDPVLLSEVLWDICQAEATAKRISEATFISGLTGEAIEHGANALLIALKGLLSARRAGILQAMVDETKALQEVAIEEALQKMRDPKRREEIRQAMNLAMDEQLSNVLSSLRHPAAN